MGVQVNSGVDLNAKLGEAAQGKAMVAASTALAQALIDEHTGVVPMLHGDLRETATPNDDSVSFSSLYAAAQNNGGYTTKDGRQVVFHNWTTPGTGPHWADAIQSNDKKMASIRDAYLKGLGL